MKLYEKAFKNIIMRGRLDYALLVLWYRFSEANCSSDEWRVAVREDADGFNKEKALWLEYFHTIEPPLPNNKKNNGCPSLYFQEPQDNTIQPNDSGTNVVSINGVRKEAFEKGDIADYDGAMAAAKDSNLDGIDIVALKHPFALIFAIDEYLGYGKPADAQQSQFRLDGKIFYLIKTNAQSKQTYLKNHYIFPAELEGFKIEPVCHTVANSKIGEIPLKACAVSFNLKENPGRDGGGPVLEKLREARKKGANILVFPEGTMSPEQIALIGGYLRDHSGKHPFELVFPGSSSALNRPILFDSTGGDGFASDSLLNKNCNTLLCKGSKGNQPVINVLITGDCFTGVIMHYDFINWKLNETIWAKLQLNWCLVPGHGVVSNKAESLAAELFERNETTVVAAIQNCYKNYPNKVVRQVVENEEDLVTVKDILLTENRSHVDCVGGGIRRLFILLFYKTSQHARLNIYWIDNNGQEGDMTKRYVPMRIYQLGDVQDGALDYEQSKLLRLYILSIFKKCDLIGESFILAQGSNGVQGVAGKKHYVERRQDGVVLHPYS